MPISATGTWIASDARVKHARGFTLIEILVVVVIVGLLAVGAVLAIGTSQRDDALETEAQRLDALITYVREHAELTTHEFGLRCEGDRYAFLAFDLRRGLWRAAEEDPILRARAAGRVAHPPAHRGARGPAAPAEGHRTAAASGDAVLER